MMCRKCFVPVTIGIVTAATLTMGCGSGLTAEDVLGTLLTTTDETSLQAQPRGELGPGQSSPTAGDVASRPQAGMRRGGPPGGPMGDPNIAAPPPPDPLDLTDDQRELARDIVDAMREDVRALTQTARDDIVATLTDDQAEIFLDLVQQHRPPPPDPNDAHVPADPNAAQRPLSHGGGQGGPGHGPGGPMGPPDGQHPDGERPPGPRPPFFTDVDRLTTALDLTSDQVAAITLIVDALELAVEARIDGGRAEFEAILTPEQLEIFAELPWPPPPPRPGHPGPPPQA